MNLYQIHEKQDTHFVYALNESECLAELKENLKSLGEITIEITPESEWEEILFNVNDQNYKASDIINMHHMEEMHLENPSALFIGSTLFYEG